MWSDDRFYVRLELAARVRPNKGTYVTLARGRKTWSVIETALPRLFELRSFSLVGIALVPPKG